MIRRIPSGARNDLPVNTGQVSVGGHAPAATPLVTEAVESARRGEARGWDLLFDRFHPVVRRYAMARVGDAHAADEVAQEVFVAAVTAIGRLRDRSEPATEAWFLRITRHKLADRARRLARDGRRLPAEVTVADPAEVVSQRLDASAVRLAMETLTEDQRDVLVRRFVLDQSLEEVATATRRPVGAVKSLQHRALAALARYMKVEGTR